MADTTCSVENCERPIKVKKTGLCSGHEMHLRRKGEWPTKPLRPKRSPAERLAAKTSPGPGGCLLWTGCLTNGGYGTGFWLDGQRSLAHRAAWIIHRGPIPDGLHIDHLCKVRNCVNPDHLEPVTPRENIRRGDSISGRKARQTHCKRGHEFTPENIIWDPRGANRSCAACRMVKKQFRRMFGSKITWAEIDALIALRPSDPVDQVA